MFIDVTSLSVFVGVVHFYGPMTELSHYFGRATMARKFGSPLILRRRNKKPLAPAGIFFRTREKINMARVNKRGNSHVHLISYLYVVSSYSTMANANIWIFDAVRFLLYLPLESISRVKFIKSAVVYQELATRKVDTSCFSIVVISNFNDAIAKKCSSSHHSGLCNTLQQDLNFFHCRQQWKWKALLVQ